ncbi:MAG: CYTH and CHAD domain-containing protein [Rhodomicrobium sp.]
MPQPNREFELKLDLTGEELQQLAGNPKLKSAGASSRKTLRSIYYDTPDHKLHDGGISLRVRNIGRSHIQTVKLDTELNGGLSNPIEIEDRLDDAQPSPGRIHDKRVRRMVRKAIKGSVLTKAFETVVTRTTHKLRRGSSEIEVALDMGEAVALNRRSEICEAELELIKGSPKDLLLTAQALFAKSAVKPAPMSKAEKGYRLLLKTSPARKIEPVHAEPPGIEKGQTCGEAFARILSSAREQIVKNKAALLETDEPEAAHQLRVGLTRLRSAQRALKVLTGSPKLQQLEADAQKIARAVGRLRDADVLIADIYAPVAGNPPREPGFEALLGALNAHRTAMREKARQAATSEAWTRLLLSMTLWPAMLERDPALQKPVENYADKVLQKRWKKNVKLGRRIESLEGAEQHKIRKSLKKLRYTSEFLAPLFPKAKVKPFIKRLKRLQDVFGYVNDVRMAGQLRDIAATHCDEPAALIAAGLVLGKHEAKVPEVWERAPKAWRRLKGSGPFWK